MSNNILLQGLKFTPTPKCNNIELKSNMPNYTSRLLLVEFFSKTKKQTILRNFFKKNLNLPHLEIGI